MAMQVFFSWSGARSKAVATHFADWLSQVVQTVDPWISSDIDKGTRWSPEVSGRLEGSRVGVVCLTRENLNSPWILFEAGALSKTKDAYVCTLLLDLLPTDVQQPLGQFQHTTRDKKDIYQLVRTINKAVERGSERALPEQRLDEVFETYWPKLEASLESIARQDHEEKATAPRTERELLEELLELSRANERRLAILSNSALHTKELTNWLAVSRDEVNAVEPPKRQVIVSYADPDRVSGMSTLKDFVKLLRESGLDSANPKEPPDTEPTAA